MEDSKAADAMGFVRELVADFVEVPVDRIELDADVFRDYGVESLQLVELMTAVENRLGAHLDFDDFRDARTVSEISTLVTRRLGENEAPGEQ